MWPRITSIFIIGLVVYDFNILDAIVNFLQVLTDLIFSPSFNFKYDSIQIHPLFQSATKK